MLSPHLVMVCGYIHALATLPNYVHMHLNNFEAQNPHAINPSIHPTTKGSASGSTFYETRSLKTKSVSRTMHFVQSVGLLSA
jgi:hypothetical protein